MPHEGTFPSLAIPWHAILAILGRAILGRAIPGRAMERKENRASQRPQRTRKASASRAHEAVRGGGGRNVSAHIAVLCSTWVCVQCRAHGMVMGESERRHNGVGGWLCDYRASSVNSKVGEWVDACSLWAGPSWYKGFCNGHAVSGHEHKKGRPHVPAHANAVHAAIQTPPLAPLFTCSQGTRASHSEHGRTFFLHG